MMRIFHEILRWINFYFAAGGKLEYNYNTKTPCPDELFGGEFLCRRL